MGNINRPMLLPADHDLMLRIAKHGFVDMEYIYRFAYPKRKKRTIDDRLLQLERHKYVNITRTFIPPDYTMNYRCGYRIITLGVNGLEVMENMGILAANHREIIKTSSPYRMYHQVQVASVCDTIQSCYQDSSESRWEVLEILNEKEAYLEENLNQPDAVLVFKQKGSDPATSPMIIIYLEIERSYASVKSLNRKLRGYEISVKKRLYDQKLNYRFAEQRVLFVTQTMLQRQALITKLMTQKTSLHLLVSGYQETIHQPMDSIYIVPGCEPCRLLAKYPVLNN